MQLNILSLNLWEGKLGTKLWPFLINQSETIDVFCFQEVIHSETEYSELPRDPDDNPDFWERLANFQQKNSYSKTKARAELSMYLNKFEEFRKDPRPQFQTLRTLTRSLTSHSFFFQPYCDQSFWNNSVKRFSLGTCIAVSSRILRNLYLTEAWKTQDGGYYHNESAFPDLPRFVQTAHFEFPNDNLALHNVHGMWIHGYGKQDHPARLAQADKYVEKANSLETPQIFIGDFNWNPDTLASETL